MHGEKNEESSLTDARLMCKGTETRDRILIIKSQHRRLDSGTASSGGISYIEWNMDFDGLRNYSIPGVSVAQ